MRSIFYFSFLAFISKNSLAQKNDNTGNLIRGYPRWQINVSAGAIGMIGKPSEVDQQVSLAGRTDIGYNIHVAQKKHFLYVGIGYEVNRHIADGFFTKSNNQYSFSSTPFTYKQNEIYMNYLHFSLMYKYAWLKGVSVNIGPYAGNLVKSIDAYKRATSKYQMDAPVQNKFRWGINFESEAVMFSNDRSHWKPVLGFGFQYQVSNNLSDSKSFHPLFGYVKVGFAIW